MFIETHFRLYLYMGYTQRFCFLPHCGAIMSCFVMHLHLHFPPCATVSCFVVSCLVLSCPLLFCVVRAHAGASLTLRCRVLPCTCRYTSHRFPWQIIIFCFHLHIDVPHHGLFVLQHTCPTLWWFACTCTTMSHHGNTTRMWGYAARFRNSIKALHNCFHCGRHRCIRCTYQHPTAHCYSRKFLRRVVPQELLPNSTVFFFT